MHQMMDSSKSTLLWMGHSRASARDFGPPRLSCHDASTRLRRVHMFGTAVYWFSLFLLLVFVFLYLIYLKIFVDGETGYNNRVNQTGFWIHIVPGNVYFILGFLQFSGALRGHYPAAHRLLGFVYLAMSCVSVGGLLVLLIGGAHLRSAAALMILSAAPFLWIGLQLVAIQAVRAGDIKVHRQHQLRAFALAYSIIWTRPGIIITTAIYPPHPQEPVGESGIVWWLFLWGIMLTEAYLAMERRYSPSVVALTPPTAAFNGDEEEEDVAADNKGAKRGIAMINETRVGVGGAVMPIPRSVLSVLCAPHFYPAKLVRVRFWTPTVVHLVFRVPFVYLIYPGQHFALKHENSQCSRMYSPITHPLLAAQGLVELAVRLVPEGAMSKCLQKAIDKHVQDMAAGESAPADHPPSGQATSPWQIAMPSVDTTHWPSLAEPPGGQQSLLLVAAGTGITPFVNLIRTAVVASMRVHLVWAVRANHGEEFADDSFLTDKLDAFHQLAPKSFTFEVVAGQRITAQTHLNLRISELESGNHRGEGSPVAAMVSGRPEFVRSVAADLAGGSTIPRSRIVQVGVDDR